MAEGMKQMLAKPIQLADQLSKWAGDALTNKQEFLELKGRADKLAALLRQAARTELYERPARRIMDDTEQVLGKALALVAKSRKRGLVHRLFTITPSAAFSKIATQIDNSISDVSWLLRVSAPPADDDDGGGMFYGLCPIAQNEPILTLIWSNIATLHTGHMDARSEAAASLASLARDNHHFAKRIVEEEGIPPLLRLLKEGKTTEGQENAACALGLLGRDPESVDRLVSAGASLAFAKVLKDGPMKVQAVVAWAVAELAAHNPKCQDVFAQNNIVRLLVGHLAFETVEEHSKYSVPFKSPSIHSVVLANKVAAASPSSLVDGPETAPLRHPERGQSKTNQFHTVVQSTVASAKLGKDAQSQSSSNASFPWKPQQHSLSASGNRAREMEDPSTKAYMKTMAAKALWQLTKDNADICKSITESRALLCFAVLLEKGTGDVRYNSAMALMEIARVAEHNADLRQSAFKPNSPASKAVIEQFLQIVEKGELSDLLIASVTALGCLSRTFRATETRIIGPLVRLLDDKPTVVMREAMVALTKFACTENYLHVRHSQAIIDAGGARHLVQLVYLGEQVQVEALILLCYIAKHVPDSEELAGAEVLNTLCWAYKQSHLVQNERVDELLQEAKTRLELYQARKP